MQLAMQHNTTACVVQVALEFHKWRDQFPGWFQSQFGNKLIYTGAGAADIVLSSRMNLPGKVQVRVVAYLRSWVCTTPAEFGRGHQQ